MSDNVATVLAFGSQVGIETLSCYVKIGLLIDFGLKPSVAFIPFGRHFKNARGSQINSKRAVK